MIGNADAIRLAAEDMSDHELLEILNEVFSHRFDRSDNWAYDYEVREVQRLFSEIWEIKSHGYR